MKNIHILPTDKPILDGSINYILKCIKEFKIYNKQYKIGDILDELSWDFDSNYWKPQNIYITNDEEIKEGDWYFNKKQKTPFKCISKDNGMIRPNHHHIFNCKKIILTTDQDLIKDGVKELSERWIEYIVNNPKCEYLEVTERKVKKYDGTTLYKIIIPKEKPKQIWEQIIEDCGGEKEFMKSAGLLPKQETLEEAARRYYEDNIDQSNIPREHYELEIQELMTGFAYNWQAERMYSEEEIQFNVNNLLNTLFKGKMDSNRIATIVNEWFEQFKKK